MCSSQTGKKLIIITIIICALHPFERFFSCVVDGTSFIWSVLGSEKWPNKGQGSSEAHSYILIIVIICQFNICWIFQWYWFCILSHGTKWVDPWHFPKAYVTFVWLWASSANGELELRVNPWYMQLSCPLRAMLRNSPITFAFHSPTNWQGWAGRAAEAYFNLYVGNLIELSLAVFLHKFILLSSLLISFKRKMSLFAFYSDSIIFRLFFPLLASWLLLEIAFMRSDIGFIIVIIILLFHFDCGWHISL